MPYPTLPDDARIEAELLRLCAARGPDRSFCPSEVARALLPDAAVKASGAVEALGEAGGPRWQSLMGPVRRVAFALSGRGVIEVLRKGRVVAPEAARGVIRLRAAPSHDAPSHDTGAPDGGARGTGAPDGERPDTASPDTASPHAGPHGSEAFPDAGQGDERPEGGHGPNGSDGIPEA